MAERWIRLDGRRYEVPEGGRALDAMLAGGADVAYRCRNGVCRTCILRARSGDPGMAARAPLSEALRAAGFFLPCCATDVRAVEAERGDPSAVPNLALVAARRALGQGLTLLSLEPMAETLWQPGQSVALLGPRGRRTVPIASLPEDYFLDLHLPDGDAPAEGETAAFHGPEGPALDLDAPMTVLGAGPGAGPALGIARAARGAVRLILEAPDEETEAAAVRLAAARPAAMDLSLGRAADGATPTVCVAARPVLDRFADCGAVLIAAP